MLRVSQITNTTGGIEVFVDADPNEVELLAETGRKFAIEEARRKGHMANVLAAEYGPYPTAKSTGLFCDTSEVVKAASEANDLIYRKKYILTFVGG